MRAKRITLSVMLLVGILLILTSSLSFAQQEIFETFDDPELLGWERTDNAVVQDGYLKISGTGYAVRPDLKMSGAFSVRLSLEGEGTIEIRYKISESGAYILLLHMDQVQLIREEDGNQTVLSSADQGIRPGEWVFIEFNPTPEGQIVFIDQGIELQSEEASALPAGGLMLQVLGEASARFDDLSLALEPPDENAEEQEGTEPPAEGESSAPAEAAPGTGLPAYENTKWVHLGGPPGGLGYDIRMDETNPDVMYVTDANSGIHKSTNGGLSWFNVSQDIIHIHDSALIFCATIDPFDHNSIWIGTQYTGHLYLSTDGGTTWEVREEGIRSDDDPRSLRGITVDPNDQNTVYIGLEVNHESPLIARGEVYRSTDRGMHWDLIWEGDNLARYVWIDPRDSDVIYISTGIFDRDAANSDPETRYSGGVGVVRSRDGGVTWEELGKRHGLNALYIPSLFMHPTDPDTLVVAAFDKVPQQTGADDLGVYVTYDGGDTWVQVLQEIVHAVEISTLDPDVWYAASEFNIWRTEDAGQTWVSYPMKVDKREVGLPIDMQVDPRDNYRIFINNYGGGNFLSEDGGATWMDASQGYTGANVKTLHVSPFDSARVFSNSNSGPYESLDGGVTWIGLDPIAGAQVFIPTENSFLMWNGDSMGNVWRSADEGQTWTSTQMIDLGAEYNAGRLPNPEYPINALAAAPNDPQILYAGLADGYCMMGEWKRCYEYDIPWFYYSIDGGQTWARKADGPWQGGLIALMVHPEDSQLVYASTGSGLYRSADGGDSWTALENLGSQQLAVPHEYQDQASDPAIILTMVVDPFEPDVIYAGSNRAGVFKSEDRGDTWEQASIGMDPNEQIMDLEPDPNRPGVYYAATYLSGVYVTLDGGQRWENISGDTFYHSRSQSLALSADGGVLYVGSVINGVYRLGTPQVSEIQPEAPSEPQENDQAAAEPQSQDPAVDEREQEAQPERSTNQVVLIGAAGLLVVIGIGAALALKRTKGSDA